MGSVGELREIIEVATVERWFVILAIVGPVVGLLLGAVVGARKREPKRYTMLGLCIGLLGTMNYLLWRLYNALTDTNGLDTVKNVVINGVVFVVVGALLGLVINFGRRFWEAPSPEAEISLPAGASAPEVENPRQ